MSDKKSFDASSPIGDQIRRLRSQKGLTLAALAELAGTSAPAIHRYENGWDRFEVKTLRKIASALGATLAVRLIPVSERRWSGPSDQSELLALLAPLFWDHQLEAVDLERHRSWVIGRVLMFGGSSQVRAAKNAFGEGAIKEAIQRREIDPRTRNYWNLILEGECAPKS
ncbi:MAG: helix-turn-helix domain-containing protein [Longimicrobiales bacterium]|nr:helix-turn-helix domain-containing protein [Longimicrobiales bacterium]